MTRTELLQAMQILGDVRAAPDEAQEAVVINDALATAERRALERACKAVCRGCEHNYAFHPDRWKQGFATGHLIPYAGEQER